MNFVRLADRCPGIVLDIRYATDNCFLGYPVYSQAECFVHEEVAEKLAKVQRELKKQKLGLLVWDGYRPLSAQQVFWDAIQDERYVSNPAKNKGRHTRGTAVDLTLINEEGNELLMPTPFDDFSPRCHSDAVEGIPEAALTNRAALKQVMEAHGFTQLPSEWWHFDLLGWEDDNRYPAYDLSFEEIGA